MYKNNCTISTYMFDGVGKNGYVETFDVALPNGVHLYYTVGQDRNNVFTEKVSIDDYKMAEENHNSALEYVENSREKEFTVAFTRKFSFECKVSAKNMDEAESISIEKTDDFASALYNALKEESEKLGVEFYGECDLGNDIFITSENGDEREVELL